ncbi:hypothetical protein PAMP_016204 [Pampus punctatissimus]
MMLKMVAVALLLLCFGVASADSKKCDINAAEGQTVTVPLDYKMTGSENLKWWHNGKVIVRQTPEFYHGKPDAVLPNGSLKLINLDKNNSGEYVIDVFSELGKSAFSKTINVCVFDVVPTPEIEIECSMSHVIFSCKVDKVHDGLQFEWIKNGVAIKDKNSTLKRKAEDVKDDLFKCKVLNPAMSKISKAFKQTCVTLKLFGLDFWIMVGILAGGGDEEELRLEWTNPEREHQYHHQHNHPSGHPHPHPHPHHQCQPAGHTGPRHHHTKKKSEPRSKLPDPPKSKPQPSPRRAAQPAIPVATTDDEQPPPLPQPRKKHRASDSM